MKISSNTVRLKHIMLPHMPTRSTAFQVFATAAIMASSSNAAPTADAVLELPS
jgi:hypothetical protein